jgi:uncharacterized lipoprotein YajG
MFKKHQKNLDIWKFICIFNYVKQFKKTKIMKNMFALMLVCAMMVTACSTNETTTTEATTESVDSLYQDTVELGGSVDTAAVTQ